MEKVLPIIGPIYPTRDLEMEMGRDNLRSFLESARLHKQWEQCIASLCGYVVDLEARLDKRCSCTEIISGAIGSGMSGNFKLAILNGDAGGNRTVQMSVDVPNGLPDGDFNLPFVVQLVMDKFDPQFGGLMEWASFVDIDVTTSKFGDFDAPTWVGDPTKPQIMKGNADVPGLGLTDEGVTQIYDPGDWLQFDIDLSFHGITLDTVSYKVEFTA